MGGQVGVQSEPGKGSQFWNELPAAEDGIPAQSQSSLPKRMHDKNLHGFVFVGVFEGEYMSSKILRLIERESLEWEGRSPSPSGRDFPEKFAL